MVDISRVGTYAQRSVLVSQMLDIQTRLNETQTQVNTEKVSQTYSGIASQSFRLLNLENDADRVDRFISLNQIALTKQQTMGTIVDSVDDRVAEFRSELLNLEIGTPSVPLTDEEQDKIDDIQARAFAALKDMEYFLNTEYDDSFLFSGGKTDTVPVNFGYSSLTELQAVYDGTNVRWPQSRDTALEATRITDTLDFATGGTITDTSSGGAFIARTQTQAAGGNLTVDTTSNTLTAVNASTFDNYTVGSQIRIGGTGMAAANEGYYTITAVSTDGRTITLNDDPTLTTDETITGNWTVSELNFPLGPIEVTGAGANNQTYTVTDIALDGNTLTVSPAPNLTAAGVADVTIEPQSYYQGDGLIYQHRVDDNRSIELGITAKDPAFEKAIRGMGIIAQGDLANNTQRIQEALDLLNDALDHNSNSAELSSDLESLAETIGYNQVTLNRAITDGQDYSSFLRTRAGEIEDADITEAVVRLQDDAQALEVSYQAFARITQLSLNNFI